MKSILNVSLYRHASIDPAIRAERGLPEDLIRLCVGIEDPVDLLDDLEHALLEAGAITTEQGVDGLHYVRASLKRESNTISRAVEKLAYNELERQDSRKDDQQWFVSAPGKVILFGEHAVVHGVVSQIDRTKCIFKLICALPDRTCSIRGPTLLWAYLSTPRRQGVGALYRPWRFPT